MYSLRFLTIALLSAAPTLTFAQDSLPVLSIESDHCSIYHALTGDLMKGCSNEHMIDQIVRSSEPSVAHGYVIRFGFDSETLTGPEQAHLTRLSNLLTGPLTNLCVKLVGHTDTSGNAGYNQDLSVRRAQSVRLFLVGPGNVGTTRILSEGRGETTPIPGVPGTDGQNRRVEVLAKETLNGRCI